MTVAAGRAFIQARRFYLKTSEGRTCQRTAVKVFLPSGGIFEMDWLKHLKRLQRELKKKRGRTKRLQRSAQIQGGRSPEPN